MKTAIVTLLMLSCIGTVTVPEARVTERYVIRDSMGRLSGSMVISGNRAVIRDRAGRITGTVIQNSTRKR